MQVVIPALGGFLDSVAYPSKASSSHRAWKDSAVILEDGLSSERRQSISGWQTVRDRMLTQLNA